MSEAPSPHSLRVFPGVISWFGSGLAGGVGGRYFAADEVVAGSNPARVVISGSSAWIEHLVFIRDARMNAVSATACSPAIVLGAITDRAIAFNSYGWS